MNDAKECEVLRTPWEQREHDDPASWVIVRKDNGKAIYETFNPEIARRYYAGEITSEKCRLVPILDYLQSYNRAVRAAGGVEPDSIPTQKEHTA